MTIHTSLVTYLRGPRVLLVVGLASLVGHFCYADDNGVLTVLRSFNGANGASPYGAGVIQGSDGKFYGTTTGGGNGTNCYGPCGTVFRITSEGTLTTLHEFSNSVDGSLPLAALIQGADGDFYGVCNQGGSSTNCRYGCGTVWKMTSEGTLTVLHDFNGDDGAGPSGPLIQGTDGNFYGTTSFGGLFDPNSFTGGTVFQLTPKGDLTTLHYFSSEYEITDAGSEPTGPLAQGTDGDFYGVTIYGGTNAWITIDQPRKATDCRFGCGVAYKISAGGTYTILHEFSADEGGYMHEGLIRGSDGNFYGTAYSEGPFGSGTVWLMTPAGQLNVLHGFGIYDPDGFYPESYLFEGADGSFYGTAMTGGNRGCVFPGGGTIFRISPSGAFGVLYKFTSDGTCADGASPTGQMIIGKDGHFYGTTELGGTDLYGTVFRLGCTVTIDTNVVSLTSAGGDGSVTLIACSTNCAWTAASYDSFLKITGSSSGVFTGVMSYSVAPNVSTSARIGRMLIGQETFLVLQSGIACVVAIDSTNASFGADGGAANVNVSANGTNCGWTATSHAEWIKITSGSSPCAGKVCPITPGLFCGCADGVVSYAVDSNTSLGERTGTLTIAGGTYTVTQAAGSCSASLGATNAIFGAEGGSNVIAVAVSDPECTWTAVSNDSFITIRAGSNGAGNGIVNYSVAANLDLAERTGTLTVAGITYTVTQRSSLCTVTIDTATAGFDAEGGSNVIHVLNSAGNCIWTASSDDLFITITEGVSGGGAGLVRYVVAPNLKSVTVTGTITIADKTFTVTQSAEGCIFTLKPKKANFKAVGGSKKVHVRTRPSSCDWTAVSNAPFIVLTGGTNGTGKGIVAYSVAPNTDVVARTGSLTIAGKLYTVNQSGAP